MELKKPVKILHYCWFGGNPLPAETIEYIESWKKYLPDFEIMRWDENNFDVNSVSFVRDAYKAHKWAFVSDYVRCYALYKFGGLYLDTDIQLIRGIDDLLNLSFVGYERRNVVSPFILYANQPNVQLYSEINEIYNNMSFDLDKMQEVTSPIIFTRLLNKWGLRGDNSLQQLKDIVVYPMEYFNPIGEDIYSKPKITKNTRSIHWFQASWFDYLDKLLFNMRKKHGYRFGTFLFVMRHPLAAIHRKFNKRNKINV